MATPLTAGGGSVPHGVAMRAPAQAGELARGIEGALLIDQLGQDFELGRGLESELFRAAGLVKLPGFKGEGIRRCHVEGLAGTQVRGNNGRTC